CRNGLPRLNLAPGGRVRELWYFIGGHDVSPFYSRNLRNHYRSLTSMPRNSRSPESMDPPLSIRDATRSATTRTSSQSSPSLEYSCRTHSAAIDRLPENDPPVPTLSVTVM